MVKIAKDITNDEEIWGWCADKRHMQNSGGVAICDVRYAYEIAYILKCGQVGQRPGYTIRMMKHALNS